MIIRFLTVLCCGIVTTTAGAQTPSMTKGELHSRLVYNLGDEDHRPFAASPVEEKDRSIPLAFVMSAVLPGSGQAYNGSWVKTAGFVAAEIAIAAGYITSYNRGDQARDYYQQYAHQYWHPTKYGRWLNDFKDYLTEINPTRPIDVPYVEIPTGIDFTRPASWSAADEQRVRSFFEAMHQLESAVYHASTGASFAHRIPFFGDQQYYELIGKYFHFAVGWEDYPEWIRNGEFLPTIDPELQDAEGNYVNVSDRYWEYRDDHQRANDHFRRASWISTLFIVNHLVSAIDAAVFAKLHNDRIEARMTMQYDVSGSALPGAYLRVRF